MAPENDSVKTIILHGFSQEEALKVMGAVKAGWENPKEIAFAMSTPHSVEMKLGDVLADIAEEHRYFRDRKNPDRS